MGWGWTWLGIAAVLAGCAAEPPQEPLYVWDGLVGGVWCYHTIADPDCYPAPLPDEAHRLIASAPNIYFGWRPNPGLEPTPVPVEPSDARSSRTAWLNRAPRRRAHGNLALTARWIN